MIQSIGVFCGSAKGKLPEYETLSRDLGRLLAEKNIELIYGGGNIGLMTVVADEVLARNGRVTGVIPTHLLEREVAHENLSKLLVVKDMAERKERMIALSDAFVILPGGYGTFDELFEVLSLNQLHIINKPCVLINMKGYYDSLIRFIKEAVVQGFIKEEHLSFLLVIQSPEELWDQLDQYRPEHHLEQWIKELKGH